MTRRIAYHGCLPHGSSRLYPKDTRGPGFAFKQTVRSLTLPKEGATWTDSQCQSNRAPKCFHWERGFEVWKRHSTRHGVELLQHRNMRSKFQWFTELCNSHYVSQFAAFFIDIRAERSTVKSRRFFVFRFRDSGLTPHQYEKRFVSWYVLFWVV